MKMRWSACAVLALTLITSAASGADWPQWLGPARNGFSQEKGLLQEWPKDGPKLLWQISDLGDGYGAIAAVGSKLYAIANEGMDNEYVVCLDATNGKKVWTQKIGKVGKPDQNPPFPSARSTPTVEGDFLYALGSDGDLACLKIADGSIVWRKNLQTDFGGKYGNWAYAESPLIDGDVLVCTPGGEQATLLALNKKNGEVIWKGPLDTKDEAGYSSAIVVNAAGKKQYVQFLAKGLVGVDAATGKLLWRYDKASKGPGAIQSPLFQDGIVYNSANRVGGCAVQLKAEGEGVVAEELYFDKDLPAGIGEAIVVDKLLYGTTGKELKCVEFATGKVKWSDKAIAAASIAFADGLLYARSENGEVVLFEPNAEKYVEKGRVAPPEQPKHPRGNMEKAWAHLAIADGKLYVRDLGVLWCYEICKAK